MLTNYAYEPTEVEASVLSLENSCSPSRDSVASGMAIVDSVVETIGEFVLVESSEWYPDSASTYDAGSDIHYPYFSSTERVCNTHTC